MEKNNIIGNNIYCESFFIIKGIVKIINMGYKTKSMLYQIGGDSFNFRKKRIPRKRLADKIGEDNIKLLKGHKARRMRDSDTQMMEIN